MARELTFLDGAAAATANGAISITVPVTPAFPDSINRCLAILVGCIETTLTDNSIVSVLVGGVAATLVKKQAGTTDYSIYKFHNPPKTAFNVVVTFALSSTIGRAMVYELEQIDPFDGVGATDGNAGTGTTDTRTLTSAFLATSMCVQGIAEFGGITNTTVAAVAPFVSDDTVQVGASPSRTRFGASSVAQPGGASVSAQYTISTSKPYAHAAAEFRGETLFPQASMVGMGF